MSAPMLKISYGGMELVKVPANRHFIRVGRSPDCEGVLRAPGVEPVSFLVRWNGAGHLNTENGYWSVTDLKDFPSAAREEHSWALLPGTRLNRDTIINGFHIIVEDEQLHGTAWDHPVFDGVQSILNSKFNVYRPSGDRACLEAVSIASAARTVLNVEHLSYTPFARIFESSEWINARWASNKVAIVKVKNSNMTRVFFNGEPIVASGAVLRIELDSMGIIQVHHGDRITVIRQVSPIPVPMSVRPNLVQNPAVASIIASAILTTGLAAGLLGTNRTDVVPKPKMPARTARIELKVQTIAPPIGEMPPDEPSRDPATNVQTAPQVIIPPPVEAPKPPPTTPEAQKPAAQKAQTDQRPPNAPEKAAVPQQAPMEPPKVAPAEVAKIDIQNRIVPNKPGRGGTDKKSASAAASPKKLSQSRSGLNNNSQSTNFNTVGLLGALQEPRTGSRVRADTLVDKGVVSRTMNGDKGNVAIRQPHQGVLEEQEMPVQNDKDIASASTRLSADQAFKETARGPIARENGDSKIGWGSGDGLLAGLAQTSIEGGGAGVKTTGGLKRADVLKALDTIRSQIKTCYDAALAANSQTKGRVVYEWTIAPAGSVTAIRLVKSQANSPVLEECVQDVLKGVVFPKATNGETTIVVYPFIFKKLK